MPATAGRVRMPANNRVHSSAALQTHGIWQSAIGYDPYAPTKDNNNKDESNNNRAPSSSKEFNNRASSLHSGSGDEDEANAYASFQGLLALARITGTASGANETRGSCKKCGRVGHLTFQCRNFLSLKENPNSSGDPDAAATAAFDKLKKSALVAGGIDRMEEVSEEEEEESESDSSDSNVDPELEKIIAERLGSKKKKVGRLDGEKRSSSKRKESNKKKKKKKAKSDDEVYDFEEEKKMKRRRRRSTDDDDVESSDKEGRRKENKRRSRRDSDDEEDDGDRHRRRKSRKEKRRGRSHHRKHGYDDYSDTERESGKHRRRRHRHRHHKRRGDGSDSNPSDSEREQRRRSHKHHEHCRRKRRGDTFSGSGESSASESEDKARRQKSDRRIQEEKEVGQIAGQDIVSSCLSIARKVHLKGCSATDRFSVY